MEIWGRAATLLTTPMAIKKTELWRGVMWWERRGPRAWFFEETRARSNGRSDDVPARCVIVVATARQPTRGPVLVVSLHQVEGNIVVALAVVFPVQCTLHLSIIYRCRITPGEVLGDYMSVDVLAVTTGSGTAAFVA
jgi:hypothetical protein